MSHHKDNKSSTFTMVVLAGLIGAGLGLLLAPRSGRETRARLRSKATEVGDHAGKNYTHLKGQAKETMARAADMKDQVASAIKTRGKHAAQDIESATEEHKPTTRRKSPIVNNWDDEA